MCKKCGNNIFCYCGQQATEDEVRVDVLVSVRSKAGRCFNGAERDSGTVKHAVPDNSFPSWETALCGTSPGVRGNGWKEPEVNGEITCERCLKKMAH